MYWIVWKIMQYILNVFLFYNLLFFWIKTEQNSLNTLARKAD